MRALRRSSLAVALALVAVGCNKKPADSAGVPAVTGLAAIPADATAVMSFDVGRLVGSQLVDRGIALVLARDPSLAAKWQRMAAACQLDLRAQIRRVILALGPPGKGGAPGPGLMVVSGDFSEATISACVKNAVGTGGGEVTARTQNGRTIYAVVDGKQSQWFGFGQADTVVLGSQVAWVEQALGAGPKVADSGALKALLARTDQAAPIWAAGIPAGPVAAGLTKLIGGTMQKGPQAVLLSVDPTTGLRVDLGAELASEEDAKALEDFAKTQLPTLSLLAQVRSLGPLVAKLAPTRTGTSVAFHISLSIEELNQLLQAIDRPAEDPQDSAPSVDAAPAPAAPGK